MKARIAALALTIATSVWAAAPQEAAKPAPWLLAQYDRRMPSCKSEERDVPVGTTMCRDGSTWVCSGRGVWESSGKPC